MLDVSRLPEGYLEETRAYSLTLKDIEEETRTLEWNLQYLEGYACTSDGYEDLTKTKCSLLKDFADRSFTFYLERKVVGIERRCNHCDGTWVDIIGEPAERCASCSSGKHMWTEVGPGDAYVFWMNGGLIYRDGYGWSVHT